MQASPELSDLVRRLYGALTSGDLGFFERHLSRQDGVLYIGSDPSEWWADHDTIGRIFRAQAQEMGGASIVGSDPVAYSTGDTGWVADRPRLRLPDGSEIPIRNSIVFEREEDAWKIVHQHVSIAVSNQDVVGQELTVS